MTLPKKVDRSSILSDDDLPKKMNWKMFFRLFQYTIPYAKKRNILFFLVCIRSIQLLLITWMIGLIINKPITQKDLPGLIWYTSLFLGLVILTEFCFFFRGKLALELGEEVIHDIRQKIIEHLAEMRMGYFVRTKMGKIISRFTSDAEAIRSGIQNVVFVSLVQLGGMIVACVLMMYYDWKLFLLVLGIGPVTVLLDHYFRGKMMKAYREVQESFSRVTTNVVESIKGIKVIQGFSREQKNAEIFANLVRSHGGYNIQVAENEAIFFPLLELNTQFFIFLLLLVAGQRVFHGTLHIDTLIQFFFLSNFFFSPIHVIAGQYNTALNAVAGAERIFSFLDEKPDWEDRPNARHDLSIKGKVEFQNVTFGYNPKQPVIKNINFVVEPGMTVALVGPTGSGKTTVTNLIAKFYLVNQGAVLIDDINILDIATECLRHHIGIVLQVNFLFTGTIMENILLGKPGATEKDAIEASEKLGCRDIIESLPNGFYTQVGENGVGLSLGQRQIICFCRAMVANPRIFILDEATSSVDTITEEKIQYALSHLLKDRTSFVIAHRLSVIKRADLILMMENGEIVEQGRHEELLKKGNKYAKLYRQFQLAQ